MWWYENDINIVFSCIYFSILKFTLSWNYGSSCFSFEAILNTTFSISLWDSYVTAIWFKFDQVHTLYSLNLYAKLEWYTSKRSKVTQQWRRQQQLFRQKGIFCKFNEILNHLNKYFFTNTWPRRPFAVFYKLPGNIIQKMRAFVINRFYVQMEI